MVRCNTELVKYAVELFQTSGKHVSVMLQLSYGGSGLLIILFDG